jgi:hypothetical protein
VCNYAEIPDILHAGFSTFYEGAKVGERLRIYGMGELPLT